MTRRAGLALHLAYGLSLLALPLLAAQGLWLRRRALHLPEAAGTPGGVCAGPGPALRLLVLGESPICGVGVRDYGESLPARLAEALARTLKREVAWQARGGNGLTAAALRRELLPLPAGPAPDLVVVALGVNDSTALTRRRRWRRELAAIAGHFPGIPVAFLPVPPLERFPLLPWPLSAFLGLRARRLDGELAALCADLPLARYAGPAPALAPADLAEDGYHPGAAACARWAEALAQRLAGLPAGRGLAKQP